MSLIMVAWCYPSAHSLAPVFSNTSDVESVKNYAKRVAAKLPSAWQWELKRLRYAWQIKSSDFGAGEPETEWLAHYVKPGDWAVDVGANVGQYTWQLSDLVGASGRVVAIEPVAATFGLLAANTQQFRHKNVTLLNVALSDRASVASMFVPQFDSGLRNYYEASLERSTPNSESTTVLTLAFDALGITERIALIKIDAEGHDEHVIAGMMGTIERDRPALVVETPAGHTRKKLLDLGYAEQTLAGSPNTIFTATSAT